MYKRQGFVFCDGYSVITEKIQYIHQLQNLYFALTGEELEFVSNNEIQEMDKEIERIKNEINLCSSYVNNPRNGISQYVANTERMLWREKLSKLQQKKNELEKGKL